MPNRYTNIQKRTTEEGVSFYRNPIYPSIPLSEEDIYIISREGDRYDILANEFYGDQNLWWIISSANPTSNQASMVPTIGVQLRIPANKEEVIERFERVNSNR